MAFKLPKEYQRYAVEGGYEKCPSNYGKQCLLKAGFGPSTPVVKEEAPKTKKKTTKKTK
tara:strand:+ start:1380 stop:1556 length:177 start_codon:yes stop_codon:yes gene_type:complete